MRYSLRTLLIVLLVAPPVLAAAVIAARRRPPSGFVLRTQAHIGSLETAVNAYTLHVGLLPPNLDALLVPPQDLPEPDRWDGPYLNRAAQLTDPRGNPFQYKVADGSKEHFYIWSVGLDGLSGTEDDIYLH